MTAIKSLSAPTLFPLLLSAILLFTIVPRFSVALAWTLCLIAVFSMGIMGRPGVLRVYVPLLSLLLVAPLAVGGMTAGHQQWLAALALVGACLGSAYLLVPETLAFNQAARRVREDINHLPVTSLVIWGGAFPFESAFPVLANDPHPRDIKLEALGAFTYAPFSVAAVEQKAGRRIIDRLRAAEGVRIIASQPWIDLLRVYCREHFKSELQEIEIFRMPSLLIRQVRCEAGK